MSQRFSKWNRCIQGPVRVAALSLCTIILATLLWQLRSFLWPVAAAFVLSKTIEPFVRLTSKGSSHPVRSRCRSAAAGLLFVLGLFCLMTIWLFACIAQGATTLIQLFPSFLRSTEQLLRPLLEMLRSRFAPFFPQWNLFEMLLRTAGEQAVSWLGALSARLTGGMWRTAFSIPEWLFGWMLAISGGYYLSIEAESVQAFLRHRLPAALQSYAQLVYHSVSALLFAQFRGQLLVSAAVMGFLSVTLSLSGLPQGALLGLLIGLADALPVLGAGIVLLPWSLVSFLGGSAVMGVVLLSLYVGTVMIRQLLEPRLLSRQTGFHPLAAMASMYAGLRIHGAAGLLAGPLLLILCKAVLDADKAVRESSPL